jgi:hypothetical protein
VCRRASVELEPSLQAALQARRYLDGMCRRWELDGLRDDLLLAVSELVTNSVLHARTPIVVNVSVVSGVIEVGVQDHDGHVPVPRMARKDLAADLEALGKSGKPLDDSDLRHPSLWVGDSGSVAAGRGLQLLAAITDAWGVTMHDTGTHQASGRRTGTEHDTSQPGGKEVWFTLGVPGDWAYTSACECRSAEPIHTASGMAVRHLDGPWDHR